MILGFTCKPAAEEPDVTRPAPAVTTDHGLFHKLIQYAAAQAPNDFYLPWDELFGARLKTFPRSTLDYSDNQLVSTTTSLHICLLECPNPTLPICTFARSRSANANVSTHYPYKMDRYYTVLYGSVLLLSVLDRITKFGLHSFLADCTWI